MFVCVAQAASGRRVPPRKGAARWGTKQDHLGDCVVGIGLLDWRQVRHEPRSLGPWPALENFCCYA